MIHNTDPCYPANDQKNVLLSNATPIGMYKMQRSRPATCQVSIAGEHFSAAKLVNGIEVVQC